MIADKVFAYSSVSQTVGRTQKWVAKLWQVGREIFFGNMNFFVIYFSIPQNS